MEAYRSRRKPKAEMNVVPYIDVMLVLLVIFMVTAPMLTPQHIPVELPKVASEAMPALAPHQVVTLSVQADGGYHWQVGDDPGAGQASDTTFEPQDMASQIRSILQGQPDTRVFVRADRQADYGAVAAAVAALQQGGVSQLGLLTEAP